MQVRARGSQHSCDATNPQIKLMFKTPVTDVAFTRQADYGFNGDREALEGRWSHSPSRGRDGREEP